MLSLKIDKFRYSKSSCLFENFNISFLEGKFHTLVGHSGSGKSTILNMLVGLLDFEGEIIEDGALVSKLCDRKNIGYMMQSSGLFPHMTIKDNLLLPLKLNSYSDDDALSKILILIKEFNLSESILTKYPSQISGGQKQRLALIRALSITKKYLFLDEPFSALDPIMRKKCQDELYRIHNKHPELTIIMVTHDMMEASLLSDRIYFLDNEDNKVIIRQCGSPTDLMIHPKDLIVKEFFNILGKRPRINKNSWRVAALNLMIKNNSDKCDLEDDNGNIIGYVTKDTIIESLKHKESEVYLYEVMEK